MPSPPRDEAETLKLCVSCKGCRRECPTGVDMARMKIEVAGGTRAQQGLSLRDRLDRLSAALCRIWPRSLAAAGELRAIEFRCWRAVRARLGFSAERALPRWPRHTFKPAAVRFGRQRAASWCCSPTPSTATSIAKISTAAVRVLTTPATRPRAEPAGGGRALCCGRTFLSAGLVDEARARAATHCSIPGPFVARGAPIVGLEPSCLFTLRDELLALRSTNAAAEASAAGAAVRGISGARGRRPAACACRSAPIAGRAAARSLPPEGVRRAAGRAGAAAHARADVEIIEFELLRHGRRLRLWRGDLRCLDGDGGAVAAAGGAQAPRRRRSSSPTARLPPSDRRRHEPCRASCRARAGDEPAHLAR